MPVARAQELVALLAVVASVGATAYLLAARGDEAALSRSGRALASGDPREALREAERAGDGAAVRGRAAAAGARARFALGDLPGAVADLRRAVDARPNDWRARRDLAVALAASGERDEARRQAVRALELNPRATLPSGFAIRVGGR